MQKRLPFLIIIALAIVVVVLFGSSMSIKLMPGQKGVIFRQFARIPLNKDKVYGAGFHIIAPWNDMIVYDVREQISEESMNVRDKNGMSLSVDITVRYNPMPDRIGYLHESIGPAFKDRVVIPVIRSAVREVAGRFTAEEIYSTKRSEVESAIKNETSEVMHAKNIKMQDLLIRAISLPKNIEMAIENKLTQEQEALAYKFRLEKEQSEAERKKIEAEGQASANRIVNSSLTELLLRQRGIDATLQLANSPNSKVVVIGSGKEGLPLILGNEK